MKTINGNIQESCDSNENKYSKILIPAGKIMNAHYELVDVYYYKNVREFFPDALESTENYIEIIEKQTVETLKKGIDLLIKQDYQVKVINFKLDSFNRIDSKHIISLNLIEEDEGIKVIEEFFRIKLSNEQKENANTEKKFEIYIHNFPEEFTNTLNTLRGYIFGDWEIINIGNTKNGTETQYWIEFKKNK